MAESTLSTNLTELRRHTTRFLGYGSDYTVISLGQQSQIDDAINNGLRQFYAPPILPGERLSHIWSFLKPLMNIGLQPGMENYDLPDDFGGFVDMHLEFVAADSVWFRVELTSEANVLTRRMHTRTLAAVLSTQPQYAAVMPIPTDGTTPQRWSLMIWPTPAIAYTLVGPYYTNPLALTSTTPYPLGNQPHADTLRLSCMAAAEQAYDEGSTAMQAKFMERLRASVSIDRQMMGAKSLGYNSDRSTSERTLERHYAPNGLVTYNGNSM